MSPGLPTHLLVGASVGAAVGLAALTFDASPEQSVGLFIVSGVCFAVGYACTGRR